MTIVFMHAIRRSCLALALALLLLVLAVFTNPCIFNYTGQTAIAGHWVSTAVMNYTGSGAVVSGYHDPTVQSGYH